MMMNRIQKLPWRVLLCSLLLAMSTACTQSGTVASGSGPHGNGEGILGISTLAGPDNFAIHCDSRSLSSNGLEHAMECTVVKLGEFGQVKVDDFEKHTEREWSFEQPFGPPLKSHQCSLSKKDTFRSCRLELSELAPIEVVTSLRLRNTITGKTHTERRITDLFKAVTFGLPMTGLAYQPPGKGTRAGFQLLPFPKEKVLPFWVSGASAVGDGLIVTPFAGVGLGSQHFVLKGNDIYLFSNILPDEPNLLTEPLSNRIRLPRSGLSRQGFVEYQGKPAMVVIRNENGGSTVSLLPENGSRQDIMRFEVEVEDLFAPIGDCVLRGGPNGSLILMGMTGKIGRLTQQGVSVIADLGETTHLRDIRVFPNGEMLVAVQPSGQVHRMKPDGSFTTLTTAAGALSIAIQGETGYVFSRGAEAILYEIKGTQVTELWKTTLRVNALDCSRLPEVGRKIPLSDFPAATMNTFLIGKDKEGFLLSQHCAVMRVRLPEMTAERVLATAFGQTKLVPGRKAKSSLFEPPHGLAIHQGKIIAASDDHILTLDPKDDSLRTLSLKLNGAPVAPGWRLALAPSGEPFVSISNVLYKPSENGDLVPAFSFSEKPESIVMASRDVGYVSTAGSLYKFVLSTNVMTHLFSLSNYAQASLVLDNQGGVFALSSSGLAHFAPLTSEGVMRQLASISSNRMGGLGPNGDFYYVSSDAKTVKRLARDEDGSYVDHTFYPVGPAQECASSIVGEAQARTEWGLQQSLRNVCSKPITAFTANGSDLYSGRNDDRFGSILNIQLKREMRE